MKKIIIIGCGGHAKSCVEVLDKCKDYKIAGFINKDGHIQGNKKFLNYPILGCDKDLIFFSKKFKYVLIGIGQIKNFKIRQKIYLKLKSLNFELPTIISSSASISKYTKIGSGSIIMQNAILNLGSSIGNNCIINNKTLIEHDVIIQDNCHISTGAIINGAAIINKNTFIGSGAIISNNVTIGKNSVIGSGAIVKRDIKDNSLIK